MMMKKFRNDIVTLRAVAVIAVVFFHFRVPYFNGGYAGVDIFFVLSGFLMSSIYYDRILSVKNGLIDFYSSRLKRLYPALVTTCFISFFMIYALMPEYTTLNFSKEAFRALTFSSNSFYNIKSDYFSEASETYWLLHTWSLSVEFQFYIIFPFIVLMSRKLRTKHRALLTYTALILLSFAYCIYISKVKGDSPFYLLSSRAWELLAGAAASRIRLNVNKRIRYILAITGLCMVIASVMFMKEPVSWPSLLTLIPVFGAVLCIVSCNTSDFDFKSNIVVRFIADISYSWYLSHWIVVAYLNNTGLHYSKNIIASGLIFSFVTAFISWLFIEKRAGSSVTKVAILSTIMIIVALPFYRTVSNSVGEIAKYSDYASSDGVKTQFYFPCFVQGPSFNVKGFRSSGCEDLSKKKQNILLIGDSHAAQLSSSIRSQLTNYNIIQFTASGCFPYKDAHKDVDNGCSQLMAYLFNDFLPKHKIDYAFVSVHMIVYAGDNIEGRVKELSHDLKKYIPNVYAIGQTKIFPKPFVSLAMTNKKEQLCSTQRNDVAGFNNWLKTMYESNGVDYIDIFHFDEQNKTCGLSDKGEPLFFDTNHLTPLGAMQITKIIEHNVRL
ncbi:peptidoglycan/LPS O-acetylase OafA/YrhL [Rahnella inusitata]|nr:peptidoglycan/LPS O-acetylase OafA/YrhL [Rahnella inusitata]